MSTQAHPVGGSPEPSSAATAATPATDLPGASLPVGRKVTLKDVAAAAGVSASTVSRVLDPRLPHSDTPTARKVREIARELNYRKNAAASSLRRQESGTIGVMVPRLTDTVMATLFERIFAEAQRRDIFALVSVSGDNESDIRRTTAALLQQNVDAMVLTAARIDSPVAPSTVPTFLAVRSDDITPTVRCDDHLGGYLVARHLLDLGHRHFAVLPGPAFTSTARERLAGFRQALAERGFTLPDSNVIHSGFGFDDGLSAAMTVLSSPRTRPTAVFAANDDMAHGVLTAASAVGLHVPQQLSVVGYNDLPLAEQLPTRLTSVHVPFEQIAVGLLDAIEATLRSRPVPQLRPVIPALIPRQSSGPAPAER